MKNELKLPFYLAFKSLLRGRKWTLFLTVLLMAVAFINLIFVSALFNGIVVSSNQQVVDTLTGNVYLAPKLGQTSIKNIDLLKSQIKNKAGVEAVASSYQVPARIERNSRSGRWPVVAIDPTEYSKIFNMKSKMYEGEYLNQEDTEGIIVGRQIAGGENLELNSTSLKGVNVGDKIKIIFDGFEKTFTVRGIYFSKFVESDARAFITDAAAQKIMPNIEDQATRVYIKTDKKNEDVVFSEVNSLDSTSDTFLWTESAGLMKSVSDSFISINAIMAIVATVIAAVTTFIVIYVDIINRRRQIGILRAIGIKPYIIVINYGLLAVVYAALGVALGTLIYYVILVPYIIVHPFSLPFADAVLKLNYVDYIVRVWIISLAALVSGLVPALLVTKTKMLDNIRGR